MIEQNMANVPKGVAPSGQIRTNEYKIMAYEGIISEVIRYLNGFSCSLVTPLFLSEI